MVIGAGFCDYPGIMKPQVGDKSKPLNSVDGFGRAWEVGFAQDLNVRIARLASDIKPDANTPTMFQAKQMGCRALHALNGLLALVEGAVRFALVLADYGTLTLLSDPYTNMKEPMVDSFKVALGSLYGLYNPATKATDVMTSIQTGER